MNWAIAILAFVTAERTLELWVARTNTRRLLAQGAQEHGARHYPLLVFLHAAWLAALWLLAPGRGIDMFWLAIFVLLQAARIWIIVTLGPRWTTRIIVLPGTPLVRKGPYRLLDHPNYWVVVGEIAVLPLVFALPLVALVFTILNIVLLSIRIREENKALASHR
jgi:methyltransferase